MHKPNGSSEGISPIIQLRPIFVFDEYQRNGVQLIVNIKKDLHIIEIGPLPKWEAWDLRVETEIIQFCIRELKIAQQVLQNIEEVEPGMVQSGPRRRKKECCCKKKPKPTPKPFCQTWKRKDCTDCRNTVCKSDRHCGRGGVCSHPRLAIHYCQPQRSRFVQ